MARDSGQEGCVPRLPGCSCTAHSSALCRAGQTANLKTRLVGFRTYQCWYMLYICFRAMPETFDLLRARTLLGGLPEGWAWKGVRRQTKVSKWPNLAVTWNGGFPKSKKEALVHHRPVQHRLFFGGQNKAIKISLLMWQIKWYLCLWFHTYSLPSEISKSNDWNQDSFTKTLVWMNRVPHVLFQSNLCRYTYTHTYTHAHTHAHTGSAGVPWHGRSWSPTSTTQLLFWIF